MQKCANCREDCRKEKKCVLTVPIAVQLLASDRKIKGFVDVMTALLLRISVRGATFFIEKGRE